MNPPKVTMFLLAYNYEKLLEKAAAPLIGQSYPNTELIISNNQSTDTTPEVIKKIQAKHPQVISRNNIPNIKTEEYNDIGIAENVKKTKSFDACLNHCNSCLDSGMATGDFIIFCHQDDIYHTNIIKKEAEFLLAHPEVPAVFALGNIIDDYGTIIGRRVLPKELTGKNIYTFEEIFRAILNHGNTFLITSTFMARKELFDSVGKFDDQGPFGGSDDLEMWLRILEKHPIGIIQEKLIDWRTDGRGGASNKLRTGKADFFKVMDYYLENKKYQKLTSVKDLRQYRYQKDFDNTLRAMNFLIKGEIHEAKNIINRSFSFENFYAFFENPKLLRAKVMTLKIILFFGINLGFEKPLGKFLHKKV